MNWNHWHKELSRLADDLSDRIEKLELNSEIPSAVWLVEEASQRKLIDEICKSYAETNTMPLNISRKHAILIYFRLVEGADRAAHLAQLHSNLNPSPAELDLERAAAVSYLMVEYWNSDGRRNWLAK